MDTYSVLKAVHVLAAVTWVGGALTTNLLGNRIAALAEGAGADDPRSAGGRHGWCAWGGSTWPCSCSWWSTWW